MVYPCRIYRKIGRVCPFPGEEVAKLLLPPWTHLSPSLSFFFSLLVGSASGNKVGGGGGRGGGGGGEKKNK